MPGMRILPVLRSASGAGCAVRACLSAAVLSAAGHAVAAAVVPVQPVGHDHHGDRGHARRFWSAGGDYDADDSMIRRLIDRMPWWLLVILVVLVHGT